MGFIAALKCAATVFKIKNFQFCFEDKTPLFIMVSVQRVLKENDPIYVSKNGMGIAIWASFIRIVLLSH